MNSSDQITSQIAKLPMREKEEVFRCVNELTGWLHQAGNFGIYAFALVGARLAEAAEETPLSPPTLQVFQEPTHGEEEERTR